MGASKDIWVDGNYVYDTEDDAKLETNDATRYIRADLVDKLKGYAMHDFDCEQTVYGDESKCTCGLTEVLKEMGE